MYIRNLACLLALNYSFETVVETNLYIKVNNVPDHLLVNL